MGPNMDSSSLYEAVLYRPNPGEQRELKETMDSLQHPLLPTRSQIGRSLNEEDATKARPTTYSPTVLKISFFTAGTGIALFSQYILSVYLWTDDILTQETFSIVRFALLWSACTCAIVFALLNFLVYQVQQCSISAEAEEQHNELPDDLLFLLESHFVVGALLSIALAWLISDILQIPEQSSRIATGVTYQGAFICVAIAAYVLLLRWIVSASNDGVATTLAVAGSTRKSKKQNAVYQRKTSNMMMAFQLIGILLGLFVGASSQFFLAAAMWKSDKVQDQMSSHLLWFSSVWSILTVFLTLLGCLSLRFLVYILQEREESGQPMMSVLDHQRLLLRMEAAYVSSCLMGICAAWIVMDLLMNMPSQILPSVAMLLLSLGVFRVILYCFPEEACVDDDSDDDDFCDVQLVVV